mgnify:CR=1 FL=1
MQRAGLPFGRRSGVRGPEFDGSGEREVVELDQRRSLIVGFGALAAVIALLALL